MKKNYVAGIFMGVMIFTLSGCSYSPFIQSEKGFSVGQEETAQGETMPMPEVEKSDDEEDVYKIGTSFEDGWTEGLYLTINASNVYQNIEDAGLKSEDFIYPYNTYMNPEDRDVYQIMSDYIKEDGSIDEKSELLVLDLTIKNESGVGLENPDIFNIGHLILIGGSPASDYYPAYFTDAGKADPNQLLYYELKQGEELHTKVGYLVLKKDMDNLIGQFRIGESSIYYEVK